MRHKTVRTHRFHVGRDVGVRACFCWREKARRDARRYLFGFDVEIRRKCRDDGKKKALAPSEESRRRENRTNYSFVATRPVHAAVAVAYLLSRPCERNHGKLLITRRRRRLPWMLRSGSDSNESRQYRASAAAAAARRSTWKRPLARTVSEGFTTSCTHALHGLFNVGESLHRNTPNNENDNRADERVQVYVCWTLIKNVRN